MSRRANNPPANKLRATASLVLLTLWMVAATLIYFRQFAQPALSYFSRVVARH